MRFSRLRKDIKYYGRTVVGPVVLPFTEWILSEAEKRGIKRIYFLARDGYLLYKTAIRICEKRSLSVECRYLYCSRLALRIPSYSIIGDEALELITLGGYYITVKSVLKRAALSENEITEIIKELGIKEPEKVISKRELDELKPLLKNCSSYKNAVAARAKAAYAEAIAYLRQEGAFENECFAIADSGWTGSMQRSLRQLLRAEGFTGKICGFYFGMYVSPKEKADGDYLTFYFDSKHGAKRKANFNNNLFECMLSAPHAMTVGYTKKSDGAIKPIFAHSASAKQTRMICSQIDGVLEYVDKNLSYTSSFVYKKELVKIFRLLKRFMVYPTRRFAEVYGKFAFCDDITEGYYMTLADRSKRKLLKKYMLFPRIFRKAFGLKTATDGELFWPYGAVAFCPAILRPWYRFNLKAWEFLKAVLR